LNTNYDANVHWTSKHRQSAGFSAYTQPDGVKASFTINDVGGLFTKMLEESGNPHAADWKYDPPTYHIEVKSTVGDMNSRFHITPKEFDRVRHLA
jgi:hypothetical protein